MTAKKATIDDPVSVYSLRSRLERAESELHMARTRAQDAEQRAQRAERAAQDAWKFVRLTRGTPIRSA
jgi:hypothetical protein